MSRFARWHDGPKSAGYTDIIGNANLHRRCFPIGEWTGKVPGSRRQRSNVLDSLAICVIIESSVSIPETSIRWLYGRPA